MKRRMFLLLSTMVAIVMSAQSAGGVPGPDPDAPEYFDINVQEIRGAPEPLDRYSNSRFFTADGWDFGDRAAYACAWVEFYQAGNELFEVHYEMVANYPTPIEINDLYGLEAPDPEIGGLCGDASGSGPNEVWDGSDHFPHGTALDFSLNGVQVATLDYFDDECAKGYWTPGNEAGEAWLWWDEDGPQNNGHHDLNCGGGSGEPIPVVRAYAKNMAPGVVVCTRDSMAGDWCSNMPPPEPPVGGGHQHHVDSDITFKLKGRLKAVGHVSVGDGTAGCLSDRVVLIERRASGDWVKAGKDHTNDSGRYTDRLPAREGTYRARVRGLSLDTGEHCMPDKSRKRVFDIG